MRLCLYMSCNESKNKQFLSWKLNLFKIIYSRLHSDQEVTLKMEGLEGEPSGRVVRLDGDGYLVVQLTESGQLVTAHPDGNSFDMMQGLIVPKVAEKDWNICHLTTVLFLVFCANSCWINFLPKMWTAFNLLKNLRLSHYSIIIKTILKLVINLLWYFFILFLCRFNSSWA